jgi:hypothetical protein
MKSQTTLKRSTRTALWIGGVALLLISVLAGFGNFGALVPLVITGDPEETASNIANSDLLFRIGVLCLLVAAVLDIVVAAALNEVLQPVNATLSTVAAWFRIAYSAVFLVAIGQLALAPGLVDQPTAAMNAIDAFFVIWRSGLVLFAVHLLLVGYLGFRSEFMPRVLGILIAVAGIGYLIDGVCTVLIADYSPTVSTVTFVGEVALIVWMIARSARTRTLVTAS